MIQWRRSRSSERYTGFKISLKSDAGKKSNVGYCRATSSPVRRLRSRYPDALSCSRIQISKTSPRLNSTMSGSTDLKRKRSTPKPALKTKKLRRGAAYHSSSEEEAEPVENDHIPKAVAVAVIGGEDSSGSEIEGDLHDTVRLGNVAMDTDSARLEADLGGVDDDIGGSQAGDTEDLSADSDLDADPDSDEESTTSSTIRTKAKRTDPTAFANSISKILSTKLTTTKRADPLLSRSKSAHDTSRSKSNSRLELAARRKLRADKKAAQDKGHVADVLRLDDTEVLTGEVVEEERRLKRTAQRGVVKLFNAVRAAQVNAQNAGQEAAKEGVVGIDRRKERVDEMSRKGFLEMLSEGGAAR